MLRAYLDVDGVLADFYSGAARAVGFEPEELRLRSVPGVWDMSVGTGLSEDEFWERIDDVPGFWENLDVLPQANQILNVVEQYFGKDNILLLTKPPRNPQSCAGKATWIRKNFPKYYRSLMIGSKKHLLAHPWAVLIDDFEENCNKFKNGGGLTVLVPSVGNRLFPQENQAAQVVADQLADIWYINKLYLGAAPGNDNNDVEGKSK